MILTVVSIAAGILAAMAQRYRMQRDLFAVAVTDAHKWIDEIIEALENKDEAEGNGSVDRLVAQFSNDERPVPPVDKSLGS